MSRWNGRAGALLCGLVVAMLLATSCGSDSSDGSSGDPSGPATTEASGPTDVDPSGVLKMTYPLANKGGAVPFDGDPTHDSGEYNDGLLYMIYGRLLRPTADGGLVPDQAESVTVSSPTTIDVKLRPDQTFTDGTPFDAAAVKASFERTRDSGAAGVGAAWKNLGSIDVKSPTELTLNIPNGTAAGFYDTIATFGASVLKANPVAGQLIGAGPMKVVKLDPSASLILEKNDGYWDAESINLAGVEVTGADRGTERPAIQSGQVDFGMASVEDIESFTGDVVVDQTPNPSTIRTMPLCKRDGPLADVNVRRALNKAIDREALNTAVYADTEEPATQLWPEGHRFYDPDVADRLAYDLEGAKADLAKSAYPDGFTFDGYVLSSASLPQAAQVIQQQLQALNVTMNIVPAADITNQFLVPQASGAGFFPSLQAGVGKIDQWTGESLGNVCKYNDPQITELRSKLAAVGSTSDEAVDLWHQVEDRATDQALSVFLTFGPKLTAYNEDKVGGFGLWPAATFSVPDVHSVYIKAS